MFEGGNGKDRQLERILNEYIDDLNQGNKPNKAEFLKEYPSEIQEELDDLILTVHLFKRNIPLHVRIEQEKKKMRAIAIQIIEKDKTTTEESNIPRIAANFRKNNSLTKEEEKTVEDCILEIIKDIEEVKK